MYYTIRRRKEKEKKLFHYQVWHIISLKVNDYRTRCMIWPIRNLKMKIIDVILAANFHIYYEYKDILRKLFLITSIMCEKISTQDDYKLLFQHHEICTSWLYFLSFFISK